MTKIKRKLFKELKDHLSEKEISLIVGPRQAGKTFLMQSLKEYLDSKGEKNVFLSLDYEADKKFFISQEELIQKIELELGKEKGFVFIDEIQRKENAGLFLKGIYDLGLPYKFIVSSSGSLELKEKIHESLVGRKRLFELGTVSFDEFADFKTDYKYSDKLQDFFTLEKDKTLALLAEYLNFGGYPRVILENQLDKKNKEIDEIFRSYIEKDITYLLNISRPDAFSILVKILASQIGKIINYSNIAKQTGVSHATLKNYLWYAEKTFVIKTITPYFTNPRKEITKSPTVYFYDLGLRNFSLGLFGNINISEESSFVFQNLVCNILEEKLRWSSRNIHFWRTLDKAEVDFVIDKGRETLPVEVKYSSLAKPEMKRSMRSFIEKYKPKEVWVINLTLDEKIKIGDTTIKFMPFYFLFKESKDTCLL